jgi:hypothetical protein
MCRTFGTSSGGPERHEFGRGGSDYELHVESTGLTIDRNGASAMESTGLLWS